MSAGKYNLDIEAGATFRRTITYTAANDEPVDLFGALIRMQIKDNHLSETAAISLSVSSGITITEPEDGEFVIEITAAQTESIPFRQGVYDIEIEYTEGTVERILEGRVKITPQVTT